MFKTILIVLFLPMTLLGQDSDFGNWMAVVADQKFSEKWNLHNSAQPRLYKVAGDLEQLLLRAGLGYDIADKTNVMLGYDFILSQRYVDGQDDKLRVDEHRLFQQITLRGKAGIVNLMHRYRFEERWFDTGFRFRMRYMLKATVPLWKKPEGVEELFLAGYNETFINTRGTTFDRNWYFLGLGYKLSQSLKVEMGYMNHLFNGGGRDQLQVFLFVNY